ncbi:MAG: type II secretion system minor pseudopilin GspI [Candidatus Sumerlaeia bacterium]|nr:type II secretion system minor pseudopilin GspI [Candidatus Sumerlaeia bacterium]
MRPKRQKDSGMRRCARRPRRFSRSAPVTSAFSLLETLVAVAIFSIAVVALIEAIAGNTRNQAWMESQSRGLMLAQNIIEEIEYVGDLRVGSDSGEFPEDPRFSWSSDIQSTDLDGLFEVRVTVSWTEGQAQRDISLTTYMRPGDNATSSGLQTELPISY